MTKRKQKAIAAKFSYAIGVMPQNGQIIHEFPDGMSGKFRAWLPEYERLYPKARRQLSDDDILVIDDATSLHYAVDLQEALEQGLAAFTEDSP